LPAIGNLSHLGKRVRGTKNKNIYIYISLVLIHCHPSSSLHCINAFFVSQTPCVVARPSASLHRLHFLRTNLTFLSTAFLLPASLTCNLFFSFCYARARQSASRYIRRREPEAAGCPTRTLQTFPSKIGISPSIPVFSFSFLVFFSMVATSGGWCGTKLGLFWFHTQKSHRFVFRLLNKRTSFHFSYRLMIIIILSLNN